MLNKIHRLMAHSEWTGRLLLSTLLVAACGSSARPDADAVIMRDSAGITIIEYPQAVVAGAPVWTVGELLAELGGPEADVDHDMTGVESALLEDGGFVVGDGANMQLRRFSDTGALLDIGAGAGEGPGELLYLASLLPTPDGFAVVDFSRGVLVLYDDSLRYRKQVNLASLPGGMRTNVIAIDSDSLLYTLGGPRVRRAPSPDGEIQRDPLVVERIVSGASSVDTLFQVPGGEFYYLEGGTRTRRFAMRPFVQRTPEGFVSGDGDRWEIVMRGPDGQVRRLIRLDWPRRPVTDTMRAALLQDDHKEIDALPAGGFKGIRRMAEIDFANPRFPDSLPPYDKSQRGGGGTLWLREGAALTDSLRYWLVVGGDSLLGRLELPSGLTLLAAERGRVLLRRTDSLDIGYLELRTIRPKQ